MMMTLKYKTDHVAAWRYWLAMALVVPCMVALSLFWSGDAHATTTQAATTTACYPTDGDPTGERCDETRTDDGAVEWDAYDETPKCVGYVASGAIIGLGTGGLAGAAWGTGGGLSQCWIATW